MAKALLTEGPVLKTLIKMALPMMFSFLASILFNLIDTYFVGLIGTNHLAAMSFTFPVVFVAGGLAMGIGVGASAVISRAIGEDNFKKVQRLTMSSLLLAVSAAILVTGIGLLTLDPVFRALGADDHVLVLIKQYMYIWYPGMIFFMISLTADQIIRATGDTKTSALITLAGVFINLLLDPILIFGLFGFPRLELIGAAAATVLSRGLISLAMVLILVIKMRLLVLEWIPLKRIIICWKQILAIGSMVSLSNILRPLGMAIITRIVAGFGNPAVAAFGVGLRIEALAMVVVMAFGASIGPFVGQNLGAKNNDRIKEGVKADLTLTMSWGFMMALVLYFLARPVAEIFNNDPEVIHDLVIYLRLVPSGLGFFGVMMISNHVLNVLGKPVKAATIMLSRVFVFYVPFAYLGAVLYQLPGVFLAAPLSSLMIAVIAYAILKKELKYLDVQ